MRLIAGDIVSAAAYSWGSDFARSMGDRSGRSESVRLEGVVLRSEDGHWVVDFGDEDHIKWKRKELRFVRRPSAAPARPAAVSSRARPIDDPDSSENSDGDGPAAPADSSEEEDDSGNVVRAGRPDHVAALPEETANKWIPDHNCASDERQKHGFTRQDGAQMSNMDGWQTAELFSYAKHFLPMNFLDEMAKEMTEEGRRRAARGGASRRYENWTVETSDLLQWIGVWIYMLEVAFPQQASSRRSYFQPAVGGYGPQHNLSSILLQGGRGERGLGWFEAMQACLVLPTWNRRGDRASEHGQNVQRSEPHSEDDPFKPTRRFWDSLRTAFRYAVIASWLVCLDESMVQWTGRGMPGLMVILRKPTPIGLELHTLCCALSGILIWFEVYEGKEAMAKKPYNKEYPKSIALTLRMCEPFFGSVCCLLRALRL